MKFARVITIMLAALAGPAATLPAVAQTASQDRAVKIITPPPGGTVPDPAPSPAQPPAAATAPPPVVAQDEESNPAGLTVEIAPGTEVTVGSRMSVKVATKREGYLVLVDVDSAGTLTQVYPNRLSLLAPAGSDEQQNLLKPGRLKVIPEPTGKDAFEFVASPPTGLGMLVAILSDAPVLYVDLPNVPAAMAGQRGAAQYLVNQTRSLRILPAEDDKPIRDPKWSFAVKFYTIRQ